VRRMHRSWRLASMTLGAAKATELLYHTDSYLREFRSDVVARDDRAHAVALLATAFFPTGRGQPHDTGGLSCPGGSPDVLSVRKDGHAIVWHALEPRSELSCGEVGRSIDWTRRYLLMRTHTAQHILNGVIWRNYGAKVTGASMTRRRSPRLRAAVNSTGIRAIHRGEGERRSERDLPVEARSLPRIEADRDQSLLRLKANLFPRSVDPLRVIEIVGLDRQADGGTHVATLRGHC
jgi:misacylated tRNA(Ala) deacylase